MKKRLCLIAAICMFLSFVDAQTTVYNWNSNSFGANGVEAKRVTIGRIYYNQFHWGSYGNIKFFIKSTYFKSGYVEYLLQGNPAIAGNFPTLSCLSAGGYNASFVKLELGEQVNAGSEYSGGINYYKDLYLDVDYYTAWYIEAEVTGVFSIDKFSITSSEYSHMTFFSTPATNPVASFMPHKKSITIPGAYADFQLTGKLGIATTAEPKAMLEVNGNIFTSSQNNYLQFGTTASTAPYITGTESGHLAFGTQNTAKVWVMANGNMGIGVGDPNEKLSVNGNVRAKKMIVSQTGWPDYVFDPAYKLKPLSELAAFIQKNQHLPEMPSAKEVEEKGISVGDQQALLLKKIEELTLYMLQQQQQIKKLTRQVEVLQSARPATKKSIRKPN